MEAIYQHKCTVVASSQEARYCKPRLLESSLKLPAEEATPYICANVHELEFL